MKIFHKSVFLFGILMIATMTVTAQDESFIPRQTYLNFSYGYGFAIGDLSSRYESISSGTAEIEYLLGQNRFSLLAGGSYYFSQVVKQDVLAPLRINNQIVGKDRASALISLDMNGYSLLAGVGYMIPFNTQKATMGIKISLAAAYLQHKIRIQDDANSAIQLNEPYSHGYDRLTGGPALRSQLAYRHLAYNRKINFEIGIKNIVGITKNLRKYNYDTGLPDNETRLDDILSFYGAFSIPISRGEKEEEYYY